MKPSVIALIPAESAQAARTFSTVQYSINPNGYQGDSSVEKEPIAEAAIVESVQIIQEPLSEVSPKVAVFSTHELFAKFKKVLSAIRAPRHQFTDGLITPQHRDTVERSESLNLEDADALKTRQRKAELERIERYKTGGL